MNVRILLRWWNGFTKFLGQRKNQRDETPVQTPEKNIQQTGSKSSMTEWLQDVMSQVPEPPVIVHVEDVIQAYARLTALKSSRSKRDG